MRLVGRAKKPLGEGAPAYGGRQSTMVQPSNIIEAPTENLVAGAISLGALITRLMEPPPLLIDLQG
jgi:hypothetical protein